MTQHNSSHPSMFWAAALFVFAHFSFVSATPHNHAASLRLPDTWHQPRDHPVHNLFARGPGDGLSYAAVGTAEWSAGFPPPTGPPDPALLPKPWKKALKAAIAAGKIPDIPQSHNTPGVNPVYPDGVNPLSVEVCSATYKCRHPDDIWDGPSGSFASSFDDGPLPTSGKLLDFLKTNNEKTTHFMIGVNILQNPQMFLRSLDAGHDIAAHTWSHPYMTTLSNEDIVGQLGWTMQLIHNSTNGRIPKYWRPPYGDSDNRVQAIAKELFGLTTVLWNYDTRDWGITQNSTTISIVQANMTTWLGGSKTPGLIILEHETSDLSVQAFMVSYPMIKARGWTMGSLASIVGDQTVYQNAKSATSDDVKADGILANPADPADDQPWVVAGTPGDDEDKPSSASHLHQPIILASIIAIVCWLS